MSRGKNRASAFRTVLLLTASLLLVACGGDDDDDGGDGAGGTFTCSAQLNPTIVDYVVSGDLLELSGNGTTETWERVEDGSGDLAVYGTWRVGSEEVPGAGVVTLDFLIEPGEVSALADCDFGSVSGSAQATSAADITDTSIAILESDQDVQVITR